MGDPVCSYNWKVKFPIINRKIQFSRIHWDICFLAIIRRLRFLTSIGRSKFLTSCREYNCLGVTGGYRFSGFNWGIQILILIQEFRVLALIQGSKSLKLEMQLLILFKRFSFSTIIGRFIEITETYRILCSFSQTYSHLRIYYGLNSCLHF